jgi:LysM repeat protein
MRGWKRLFYYLVINVIVSACTMVAVLAIWQHYNSINQVSVQIPFFPQSNSPSASLLAGTLGTPSDEEATLLEQTEEPFTQQSTPSPTLRAEQEYRIQAGDTLGAIAVRFGVTVDEIMRANDITDPDRLVVGVVLIIPAEVQEQPPEAEETSTPTATQTTSLPETPTETPPPASGTARVLIDSVVGAGDLESERVMLKRSGPGELSLAGWQLVEEGGETFIFPQLILFEGGAVNIYTRAGQATVVALYWGLRAPVWESGEEVLLLDNQGNQQASYIVP